MDELSRKYRIAGGVLGLLAVALTVPSYIVATPDTLSTPVAVDSFPGFLFANGTLVLLHVIALTLFVCMFAALLPQAGAAGAAPRFAVLGGGLGFSVLTAIGVSVEILLPAAVLRFPEAALDPAVPLALALWIYGFALAFAVVMLVGVAVSAFTSGTFPGWFGWLSLLIAVVALTRPVIGPWAAIAVLAWFVVASALMLTSRDREPVAA